VITLNGQVGSDGQVLTSKGPGVTPIWTTVSGGGSGFTGAGTSITNITGAANNTMTITSAVSGNGNLNLNSSGTGAININLPWTSRASGSVSITGANPNGTSGGHIYIQSAYSGSGPPGNIYIDGQYDEVGAIGGIYIGTGIDGAASASSEIKIGVNGGSLYLDSYIINGFKIANNSSTVPPIRFSSGSNSGATITNNTIDYVNGSLLTLSPEFATAGYGRAAIYAPVWAYSNANSTASTSTTAQALFPTGSRTMTLVAGNNYYFKLLLSFTSTFTSGTATIQLVPVFSNTPQSINYTSLWIPGTAGNALAAKGTTTAATSISPSITATQTNAGVIVEGNFRANATTGGTLRFDFRMSATGSSTVALSGSYQQIMNLGNLGANTPAVVSGGWT
jgi:hypothetical protein